MTEFNKPTPEDDAFNHVEMMSKVRQEAVRTQMQALPEKPQFEAITSRLDRIGAESGIKEMTNELYLYGVNVREDLGKEFNYYFHLTRNDTIEEVAQHIEKMRVFGNDTISSFAIYIREMKK
jgi:hypothetical protein